MGLKVVIKSLNEVPEALQSFYTQVGDEYVLETDDKDYKQRIGEFRQNNIDLSKRLEGFSGTTEELKALQEKLANYGDLDADAAREALKLKQDLEDK